MKKENFYRFQNAADDEFLEEAQSPRTGRCGAAGWIALAACLGLIVAGSAVWRPWETKPNVIPPSESLQVEAPSAQLTNPVHDTDLAALLAYGYDVPIPAGAQNVRCQTIERSGSVPMAQVCYELDDRSYNCRALRTAQSEDISGLFNTWDADISWQIDQQQLRLCSNTSESWVGWYDPSTGIQWCLSANADGKTLLTNVDELAMNLGVDLSRTPNGAENVQLNAFLFQDLIVSETLFTFDGVHYSYRVAATSRTELEDISGQSGSYTETAEADVGHCAGTLCCTENGQGKLLWLDVVPGLVYSLSCEEGANREMLPAVANAIFNPAQGGEIVLPQPPDADAVMPTSYDEVLSRYRQALLEHWDSETLSAQNISSLCLGKEPSQVGYTLLDADLDGVDELLIALVPDAGETQISTVLALYTCKDGRMEQKLLAGEGDLFYIYSDEAAPNAYWFYETNARTDLGSVWQCMHLEINQKESRMKVDQAVVCDPAGEQWYLAYEENSVVKPTSPIDEALAKALIENYESHLLLLPLTSFAD